MTALDASTPAQRAALDEARALEAGTVSPEAYKAVFRRHPAGVAVVTLVDDDGHHVGFTATSVISVSAEPPLLAFSISGTSSSWPALARASTLALSFLADHQDDVSARFATSGIDRFAAGGWSALRSGPAVIDGAHSWVLGRVVERTRIGGSHLVAVHAAQAWGASEAAPLVYHDRTYHRIGDHTAI
jgi:flavin reductase (DIM6/NTAB) family NADH-FMN oxidoreductase RutF